MYGSAVPFGIFKPMVEQKRGHTYQGSYYAQKIQYAHSPGFRIVKHDVYVFPEVTQAPYYVIRKDFHPFLRGLEYLRVQAFGICGKIAPVRGITEQMYLFFSYPGQKELKKEAVPNIFILILTPPKIKSLV